MAQVLAGIRGPLFPFDGESVDIEPMNVPHHPRMDSIGTALDEIYAPAIPGSVDWQCRKRCKTQNRSALNGGWAISTCIPNAGPCKWAGMEETCSTNSPRQQEVWRHPHDEVTRPRASIHPGRRRPRRSGPLPVLILNAFIPTPPLAPSLPLPLCRPQRLAHRH